MSTPEVRALAAFVDDVLPHDRSHWPPPGWPGEAEAALLDAVFSARATYGTPRSGVRRVVGNWRTHRDTPLDDLTVLAALVDAPDRLATILGNDAVHEFVADALDLGDSATTEMEALDLLGVAADTAGVDPAALLGAVWRYHRTRDRAPKPLSA